MLIAAFFEQVEFDGHRPSFVKPIDRVLAPGPSEFADLALSLVFVPGSATDRLVFRLAHRPPRRAEGTEWEVMAGQDWEFPDEPSRWEIPIRFQTAPQGVHWFEVRAGGRLLTRVPLRVVYPEQLPR